MHPLILGRWSPKAFDMKPVEQAKIDRLFEAAGWAPSGSNAQPWRFLYATREMPEYDIFFELINKDNQVWAGTASMLVLALAQAISTYKERPNRLALFETGMAVSNLLLQATYMGLFVHQMAGYDHRAAKRVLSIPERYEPATMMAIGYKGDRNQLPADQAAWEDRERVRMGLDRFLIRGAWDPSVV